MEVPFSLFDGTTSTDILQYYIIEFYKTYSSSNISTWNFHKDIFAFIVLSRVNLGQWGSLGSLLLPTSVDIHGPIANALSLYVPAFQQLVARLFEGARETEFISHPIFWILVAVSVVQHVRLHIMRHFSNKNINTEYKYICHSICIINLWYYRILMCSTTIFRDKESNAFILSLMPIEAQV